MSRPYTPYPTPRAGRGRHASGEPVDYPDDFEPTQQLGRDNAAYGGHPYYDPDDPEGSEGYDGADYYEDEFAYYPQAPADNRWLWVAGTAGAILLVAVICTAVILGGGDSGSVSGTVAAPEPTQAAPTAPRTVIATPAPPTRSLAPETITTVTPTPSATATPTESAPPPPPAETVAPTQAAPAPRTVTYRVTGNRPLLDLVTVIYTDQQGALQTDVNAALPWAKTIELNQGVELTSVTATSVTGQLNCSITDANGNTIVAQNNNSMIATCTR